MKLWSNHYTKKRYRLLVSPSDRIDNFIDVISDGLTFNIPKKNNCGYGLGTSYEIQKFINKINNTINAHKETILQGHFIQEYIEGETCKFQVTIRPVYDAVYTTGRVYEIKFQIMKGDILSVEDWEDIIVNYHKDFIHKDLIDDDQILEIANSLNRIDIVTGVIHKLKCFMPADLRHIQMLNVPILADPNIDINLTNYLCMNAAKIAYNTRVNHPTPYTARAILPPEHTKPEHTNPDHTNPERKMDSKEREGFKKAYRIM